MITHSAAPAAPAAAAGASPAAVLTGSDTLPADLLAALFSASGPPFAATLQALHALAPALAAKTPTMSAPAEAVTKAGAAAALTGTPSGGGNDVSPQPPTAPVGAGPAQLLLAKYAAETGALPQRLPDPVTDSAEAGARPASAAGRTGKAASAASDSTSGASAAGNAPLLALVLQWLQQQGGDAQGSVPTQGGAESSRPEAGAGSSDAAGRAEIAMVGAATGLIGPAAKESDGARGRTDREGVTPANAAATTTATGDLAAAARQSAVTAAFEVLPDALRRPPELPAERQSLDTHAAPANGASVAPPDADPNAATAGMDLASALRAATAASSNPAEHTIAVPVHDRHWPQALAAQVLILSNDKMQAATLRLSPEHLGPVDVRIDLNNSQVNVTFSAAHVETRAALEQALPQLRAVLAGAGLALGQATVQQQARRESQNSGGAEQLVPGALERPEAMATVAQRLGLVDEYV